MRCQRHRMHIENFELLNEFEFMFKKAENKGPMTDALMKKPRVENLVTLSL
jgi:hypothetical protein